MLAVAALLAIWTPIATFRNGGWSETPDLPALIDASVAELRPGLRPGERIGVLVPPLDPAAETAFWYSAQYAMAPAVVEPILLRDCFYPEPGPRCRIGSGNRVAALRADPETIAFLELRLGLTTVGRAGSAVVLAKIAR